MTQAIAWFAEVGKDDVGVAGGKGANLGEMTRARIPVPPGFIVTADTYRRFLEASGLRPTIENLVSSLDYDDSAQLQRVSREIKDRIVTVPVPQDISRDIKEAYRKLGGGAVAVRSSATAEDLKEASFAGQQATFLNVSGEDAVVAGGARLLGVALRGAGHLLPTRPGLRPPVGGHRRAGAAHGAVHVLWGDVHRRDGHWRPLEDRDRGGVGTRRGHRLRRDDARQLSGGQREPAHFEQAGGGTGHPVGSQSPGHRPRRGQPVVAGARRAARAAEAER